MLNTRRCHHLYTIPPKTRTPRLFRYQRLDCFPLELKFIGISRNWLGVLGVYRLTGRQGLKISERFGEKALHGPRRFLFSFWGRGACDDEICDKMLNFSKNPKFPTLHQLARSFPTKYNPDKHRKWIFQLAYEKRQTKIVEINFNVFYWYSLCNIQMFPYLRVARWSDLSFTRMRTCIHVVVLAEDEININLTNDIFKHFHRIESSKHSSSPVIQTQNFHQSVFKFQKTAV